MQRIRPHPLANIFRQNLVNLDKIWSTLGKMWVNLNGLGKIWVKFE